MGLGEINRIDFLTQYYCRTFIVDATTYFRGISTRLKSGLCTGIGALINHAGMWYYLWMTVRSECLIYLCCSTTVPNLRGAGKLKNIVSAIIFSFVFLLDYFLGSRVWLFLFVWRAGNERQHALLFLRFTRNSKASSW